MTDPNSPYRGIALRLLSGLFFAAMIVMVKATSDSIPLGEIVFFRSAFALIPLLIFLHVRGELPTGLKTNRPWGHILRSGFGTLAMFTSFATVARLPIAEATLISYLAPALTAIAGVVLLGEHMTRFRIGGILLGFAGVAVLVWPELGNSTPVDQQRVIGLLLGIVTAILTALALTMTRTLTRSESPGAIAFWFAITASGAGLLTLPTGWVLPDLETMMFLVLAGLFGGFVQIAMTLAFSYAEASRLAPFEYVALIWTVLADLLIFQTPLAPAFLLALPLVLGGAMIAALERDRRAKLEMKKA